MHAIINMDPTGTAASKVLSPAAFMNSEAFVRDPIGVEFDPEVFVKRVGSGEDEAQIKRRPDL